MFTHAPLPAQRRTAQCKCERTLIRRQSMSRLTSSVTCQLISVIITTLTIHHLLIILHSFTPGSEPTFSTNPSTLILLPWPAFTITGPDRTYHASQFIVLVRFYTYSLIFMFVPCGRLSWLHVSFLLHVKYTLSYRTGRPVAIKMPVGGRGSAPDMDALGHFIFR